MATHEEERAFIDIKLIGGFILMMLGFTQPLFWAVLSPDIFQPNYIGLAINIIIDIIIIGAVMIMGWKAAKKYHMD